ncbi:MAG: DUF373 family protein [Candidatus Aenigmarchaeota archaeon]|nr:DUF373 family protein [Candidatus Aenigmarchaeota archaeon]
MTAPKKDRLLVLNVDRDNDIGVKAGVKGPIIGRDAVLAAANAMGLADPQDSDFNAMFQTLRVYDELVKQHEAEVAVVTGDKDVGLKSDRIVADQFSQVLEKFKAEYVVLVTDGAEDSHVMPIIQSKVPILSVSKVIVKQADSLQSGYFKVKDFIEETLDNPKYSILFFGLPAIVLLLLGIFGLEGIRYVILVLGAFLFIKGFKLEDIVMGGVKEFRLALEKEKLSFFAYLLGAAFIVLGVYRGITATLRLWGTIGYFELAATFVSASIFIFFLSATTIWVGRNMITKSRTGKHIGAVVIYAFAISLFVYNAAQFLLNPSILGLNFIASIIAGFLLIFLAVGLEHSGHQHFKGVEKQVEKIGKIKSVSKVTRIRRRKKQPAATAQ